MARFQTWLHLLAMAGFSGLPTHAAEVPISGGSFETVLPPAPGAKSTLVAPFRLDTKLVSNAEFAGFLRAHPEWRRDRVARLFADEGYLQQWRGPAEPGDSIARQPATHVSWFAASAYCQARGARLPRWYEWELAAAASASEPDARADPRWRQKILDWYSTSARSELPSVGASPPNFYGVRDLHGVVWEWVEDAGSMLVGEGRYCGSGAIDLEQKDNYPMMMRIAMLSSMKAAYGSASMGFRCATNARARP